MRIKIIEILIRLIRRRRRRKLMTDDISEENIDITIPHECLVKSDNNNNGDLGVDYAKLGRWAVIEIRKLEKRINRLEQMK